MNTEALRQRLYQLSFMTPLAPPLKGKLADLFIGISDGKKVPAQTRLFVAGAPTTDEGVIVLDGEIRVDKPDAPEIVVPAPHLIGEMSQFNPSRQRTATVIANTDLKALVFKWTDFNDKAKAYLEPDEVEATNTAMQEYAWQHFTE